MNYIVPYPIRSINFTKNGLRLGGFKTNILLKRSTKGHCKQAGGKSWRGPKGCEQLKKE